MLSHKDRNIKFVSVKEDFFFFAEKQVTGLAVITIRQVNE